MAAQPAAPAPPPNTEPTGTPAAFRKGSVGWGIVGGGALPVELLYARADRRMWLAAVEIGRVMTERHGPGPLAGQLELALQVMPIVVRGPADFWGVGVDPIFLRWNFAGTRHVHPFIDLSAGLTFIDWNTPGPYRHARNFNEQAGLGFRIGGAARGSFVAGYRFQHVSHGSSTEPSPGVDTHSVYVGFSSLRPR